MKKLAVFALVLFPDAAWGSACRDVAVTLYEVPPDVLAGQDHDATLEFAKRSGREMNLVLICNGDQIAVPQTTTLHFVEMRNGRMCYHDRACGNLHAWEGVFGVQASWSHLTTVGKYFVGSDFSRVTQDWTGTEVSLGFLVKFGEVNRYCTRLSEPICL